MKTKHVTHPLLKKVQRRMKKFQKNNNKKKLFDISKVSIISYLGLLRLSREEFIVSVLQECFAKFSNKKPLKNCKPEIEIIKIIDGFEICYQYLHLNRKFVIHLNNTNIPFQKQYGDAYLVRCTVGLLETPTERHLFKSSIIDYVIKEVKGVLAEYLAIQEVRKITSGTNFSVMFNPSLDNLEIDVFLPYMESKLGICLQIKGYLIDEVICSFNPTLHQKKYNPYCEIRVNNDLHVLGVSGKKYLPLFSEKVRILMNEFEKKLTLISA